MPRERWSAAIVVTGVLVVASCQDGERDAFTDATPPTKSSLAQVEAAKDDSVDIPGQRAYAVELTATGSFRPNTPVRVDVAVSGRKPSERVLLDVYVPELQAYAANWS